MNPTEPIGLLYAIRTPGGALRGYLLGTVHACDDEAYGLNSRIRECIQRATALYIEFVAGDESETLQDLITENPNVLSGMMDIAVANFRLGYDKSMETALRALAESSSLETHSLETLSAQINLLLNLAKIYKKVPVESTVSKIRTYMEAWKSGNEQMITDTKMGAFVSGAAGLVNSEPATIALLCGERDPYFANKIDHLLQDPATRPFIAIGALHLYGDQGVITLLKEKGWKVTSLS